MAFDVAGAKKAGYTDQEIEAYLQQKSSQPQPVQKSPGLLKTVARGVAEAAPTVGGVLGGAGGAIGGSALLTPGAGTAAGIALGTGAGVGAGTAIKRSIYDLLGESPKQTKEEVVTEALSGPTAGLTSYLGGKALEKGGKLVKGVLNIPKTLSEKSIAAGAGKEFSKEKMLDGLLKASEKLTGTDQEKYLKLAVKEVGADIVDIAKALEIRKNIKPVSFLKKTFFGESIKNKFDADKYRILNEQIKKIPEIAKYDKQIQAYYNVRKVLAPSISAWLLGKTGVPKVVLNAVTGGKD